LREKANVGMVPAGIERGGRQVLILRRRLLS